MACDLGIALVGQDALAAAALPDLNFADDAPVLPWVFRKRFIVQDHTTAGAIMPTKLDVDLDLKSQRKIGDAELVLIINYNGVSGSTFVVSVEGLIRCLFLLP